MKESVREYIDSLANLKEERALRLTRERLEAGEDPLKLIDDIMKAMNIVGRRFEEGEYFIADLMMAAEILREIMSLIEPRIKPNVKPRFLGRVIIGTVEGDIHDIGKDLAASMLKANGFEVIDLGVDVPPEEFVKAIKEYNANIVGISALLTMGVESMKRTIEKIKEAGLRDKVKIMIGGGATNEIIKEYVGADAYAPNPLVGVKLAKEWTRNE